MGDWDRRARRGRRILFRYDEFTAWTLACRLRRLPPDALRFVAAAITACEIEVARSATGPDSDLLQAAPVARGATGAPGGWPSR